MRTVSEVVSIADDKQVTSHLLSSLFRGKSSNSPAFLFAVLKAEGFVKLTSEKPRLYHKGDAAMFLAEVMTLMASDIDLSKNTPSTPDGARSRWWCKTPPTARCRSARTTTLPKPMKHMALTGPPHAACA